MLKYHFLLYYQVDLSNVSVEFDRRLAHHSYKRKDPQISSYVASLNTVKNHRNDYSKYN